MALHSSTTCTESSIFDNENGLWPCANAIDGVIACVYGDEWASAWEAGNGSWIEVSYITIQPNKDVPKQSHFDYLYLLYDETANVMDPKFGIPREPHVIYQLQFEFDQSYEPGAL